MGEWSWKSEKDWEIIMDEAKGQVQRSVEKVQGNNETKHCASTFQGWTTQGQKGTKEDGLSIEKPVESWPESWIS